MSTQRLKSLTIQNLRGSVDTFTLDFEKGKPLTVIYGENGTGKSTICDALEFLGHGKVGSIEGRGLGKLPGYWASLGKRSEDISVELKTGNGACQAQVNKRKVAVYPPENKPKIEILRRSQILGLIEASPGERYKAISRFIDVSGIEDSEKNLSRLIKEQKNNSETAIALTQESLEAIQNFYEVSGIQGKDILEWAKEEVERDFGSLSQESKAIDNLGNSYRALNPRMESIKRAHTDVSTAERELASAQQKFDEISTSTAKESGDFLTLWKTAQSFFHNHEIVATCPLCDSAENAEGLATSIEQKINQLSDLNQAIERKERANTSLEKAKQKFQITREEMATAVQTFQTFATATALPADTPLPAVMDLPRAVNQLAEFLEETQHLIEQWDKMKTLRQDKKKFVETLKKSLKKYQENIKDQEELETLLPKLERALEISEDERRQFTDKLLATIAGEVGRLYERIHPGEGKDKISLELDPKKRASLGISTEFCGEADIPPQAYFSESHLDTLGLCIFLALSGLDSPESTILVLDDVLASVDEPHVDRLMHLLHDEAQRFRHCLITTHYRPWKYKLRWGWLKDKQCHFVELTKWSADRGLTLIRSVPEIERLRELLDCDTPDVQAICAKSGVILEAILDFLTRLYECKVPRRPDERYTLGDLLPALDKKLRKALRIEFIDGENDEGNPRYVSKDLQVLVNEIDRIAQARNVFGAHFSTMSFDLLEDEALAFGIAVMELADSLIDSENGWPRSSKSGSYWATSGETRRLYPLRRPG